MPSGTDAINPAVLAGGEGEAERVGRMAGHHVHRLPVPGGWIYLLTPAHPHGTSPAAVFVPEPPARRGRRSNL
jgi:hypothetical protein